MPLVPKALTEHHSSDQAASLEEQSDTTEQRVTWVSCSNSSSCIRSGSPGEEEGQDANEMGAPPSSTKARVMQATPG